MLQPTEVRQTKPFTFSPLIGAPRYLGAGDLSHQFICPFSLPLLGHLRSSLSFADKPSHLVTRFLGIGVARAPEFLQKKCHFTTLHVGTLMQPTSAILSGLFSVHDFSFPTQTDLWLHIESSQCTPLSRLALVCRSPPLSNSQETSFCSRTDRDPPSPAPSLRNFFPLFSLLRMTMFFCPKFVTRCNPPPVLLPHWDPFFLGGTCVLFRAPWPLIILWCCGPTLFYTFLQSAAFCT